jgi:hypothetical protein
MRHDVRRVLSLRAAPPGVTGSDVLVGMEQFGVVRGAMTIRGALLVAALAILTVAGAAERVSAEWVVDAKGECVEQWSPASMLRGPTAMLMSPTAPFRSAAGVFAYPEGWTTPGKFEFWGPVLAVLSGAAGVIDTCVWLGTGLVDTVTGGYFRIAPYRATQLSLDPLIPPFVSEAQQRATEAKRPDPCGRVAASS